MKFFLLLLLVISTSCLAQNKNTPIGFSAEDNLRALGTSRTANQVQLFNNRYQGVRGTPFLGDKWYQSQVVLTKGDTVHTLLKIDIHSDEIWAIMPDGDSIIVDKGLVRSFSFIDNSLQKRRTFFFDPHELGYFELLYSSKANLFAAKRKKDLIKAVISGAYTTGNPYDEFVPEASEFYIMKNNRLKLLKPKVSSATDLLGKQAKKIIEQHNLNLKSETDVLQLVMKVEPVE